ncbi:MAG: FemAB family PEP-CTERM system-associated protein [Magnetococcus sp. YQC-5]
MQKIVVRPVEAGEEGLWDRFVTECGEATFFHRIGWKKVIDGAFGHRTHYLLAESSEGLRGILPLVHLKSLLFGNALISSPFCVYGGVAACDEEARLALESAAVQLAQSWNVDWLECRNQTPRRPDWLAKDLYYTFRKTIDPDPEVNLAAIPRKQRAEVRKGRGAGLIGLLDDAIDGRCYDIYSESVRNLGTPVFPRSMFRLLKEIFAEECQGLVIEREGRGVASVVSFYFRDQVLPYYGGGVRQARAMGAMAFMYWELMTLASGRGARVFDFGRSKAGSGSFDFKKFYGFTPEPLHYRYHLVKAMKLPDVNPLNPKYRLFIKLWQHLPLPVAERLGPWFSQYLG